MTIHLGRPLPDASRDTPGRQRENPPAGPISEEKRPAYRPYSVLLPVGFTLPPPLPGARCALTAPFHPYPLRTKGGLLSVALSLESPPPGVTRHRVSVEPGLSSPRARRHERRPSSRLAPLRYSGKTERQAVMVKQSWKEGRAAPLRSFHLPPRRYGTGGNDAERRRWS